MNEPTMNESTMDEPDSTAARVALWRALHVDVDAPPHVLDDRVGLQLLSPDARWRERGDMNPHFTRPFRASIVARARFIEDLVIEHAKNGLAQYVILGAGLDSFAQRRADMASRMTIFEVDQPKTQQWKRARLIECGFGAPDWLHFVPVDFEAGESWRDRLIENGFDASKPAIVVSTGVSMYLTKAANEALLREVASLARGSMLAMTFLLPIDMADADVRPGLEMAEKGARASGTPFISFFTPRQITSLARDAGFIAAQHISADDLTARYFANRTDGLRPPKNAEELLVATT
jgi:methyltransferase (TIGR00027 family)